MPSSRDTGRSSTTRILTLDEVESHAVGGENRRPNDAASLRATTRALQAMSGPAQAFATIECEELGGGALRVTRGHDAVLVARQLRARAVWRGDDTWAALLGQRLMFRVVTRPQGQQPTSQARRGWARVLLGSAQRATGLAGA